MDKPNYPYNAIGSIDALGATLGVSPDSLLKIAKDIGKSYTPYLVTTKSGKNRDVFEAKPNLKRIQKKINQEIFEKVIYPDYLQGGVKDFSNPRDYIQNSKFHAGSKHLIGLDITNFYDSIKSEYVYQVFLNFFKFPPDVSEILTKLVTLDGRVPQGASTSSYIANLIFFNSEYSLVSRLRAKSYVYTRLLDDITISSKKEISDKEISRVITYVSALVKKFDLSLKDEKTKIELSTDVRSEYKVTGVWVGHGVPKIRRKERREIRQMVHFCCWNYSTQKTSVNYHKEWNRVSGLVSKIARLNHPQAKDLRRKLALVMPEWDAKAIHKIIRETNKLVKIPSNKKYTIGVLDKYHKLMHSIGILSRTDKALAKSLRLDLVSAFPDIPKKSEVWA